MNQHAPSWQTFLEHAELSDVGLRRSNNQDSFGEVIASSEDQWQRRGHLFMVADGMGAHAAGELASKMAVDTVSLTYYKLPDASPAEAIQKSVIEANFKIHSRGQANPDFKGMGTTTSALIIVPEGAVVAHVGDSRVYRLRGNRLEQLSFDHSLVWEMTAGGKKIPEADVPGYIPKNIITRSLGPNEQVQVDLEGPFPLAEGDTFLLCSDGLSGPVPDEDLGVLLGVLPPQEAVRTLVDLANLRGGPDNITVIIARVRGLNELAMIAPRPVAATNAGQKRQGNPLLGIAGGVLLLLGVVLALAQRFIPAGAAAVLGLIAGSVWFAKQFGGSTSSGGRFPASRLGAGPHRSFVCTPDQEFVDKLAKIVEPLRVEATQQHWDISWPRFENFCHQAKTAAARQDFPTAIRSYCHAISFMMQELRNQRSKKKTGPTINVDGN